MTDNDWEILAKKHNRKFQGKIVPAGELRKGGKKGPLPTQYPYTLSTRSAKTLKGIFTAQEKKQMVQDVDGGISYGAGVTDSELSSEEETELARGPRKGAKARAKEATNSNVRGNTQLEALGE